jgi:hypothetical protein
VNAHQVPDRVGHYHCFLPNFHGSHPVHPHPASGHQAGFLVLSQNREYAILIIAVIAVVITPTPDPFNMGLVILPLLLMYEIGILLAKLAYRLA